MQKKKKGGLNHLETSLPAYLTTNVSPCILKEFYSLDQEL